MTIFHCHRYSYEINFRLIPNYYKNPSIIPNVDSENETSRNRSFVLIASRAPILARPFVADNRVSSLDLYRSMNQPRHNRFFWTLFERRGTLPSPEAAKTRETRIYVYRGGETNAVKTRRDQRELRAEQEAGAANREDNERQGQSQGYILLSANAKLFI